MPKAQIRVANMRASVPDNPTNLIVNTCSNSKEAWSSDLSPFLLGPCEVYDERSKPYAALNMENAWQFSKTYLKHLDSNSNPSPEYWKWAKTGWDDPKAHRYPMGRGARPQYSYWKGQKLAYVAARKNIYGPLYLKAVRQTAGYKKLVNLLETHEGIIYLRDFDGYDEIEKGMTLSQVLNNPMRKAGHSFFIKMSLLDDPALKELHF